MRILIAEDDPHIARLVSFKLEKEGFEIDWVENGSEAIKKLESNNAYDLIMLDVMMPIKDGLETLQEIRSGEFPQTPIMMMTAKSQERDVLEAMEAGATEYIVKPFDPQDLAKRVHILLGKPTT